MKRVALLLLLVSCSKPVPTTVAVDEMALLADIIDYHCYGKRRLVNEQACYRLIHIQHLKLKAKEQSLEEAAPAKGAR